MPSLSRRGEQDRAAAVTRRRLAMLADTLPRHPLPESTPHEDTSCEPDVPGEYAVGRHRAPSLPARTRASAAVEERLPAVRLRADRGVTAQHVTVVAVVLVALVGLGGWWVLAGRPGSPQVVTPPVTSTASGPDAAPASVPVDGSPTSSTGSEAASVVVDVAGDVRRPGLVTLPAGSRVADALERAGGVKPGVDLLDLNLARLLVDGEQLLVGVDPPTWPGAAATAPTAAPTSGLTALPTLVDVNVATIEQLDTLPGIGPVTAQAILDWRAANGTFTSVDELLEVDGIGDATLADIRDLVTV